MSVAKFRDHPCSQCGSLKPVINGAWLRSRRQRAGLSLRAMALRLGFSAAYVCDIELNRRNCLPPVRAAYEALAMAQAGER